MSLYDVSVALHVTAAVAGFGPTFAYPVVQLAAERHEPADRPRPADRGRGRGRRGAGDRRSDGAQALLMAEGTLIGLVRGGWLVLTFAMLCSRFLFQAVGPVRMRAFLDQWQAGRTKRVWGTVALAYALVVAAGAATLDGGLSALEWILLGLLEAVLVADGLVNVLPAGFRTFKDTVQDRRPGQAAASLKSVRRPARSAATSSW